ncbi:MAG: helix-turn-helix domain-containing protein [Gammaproteobacteria bacterium]
MQSSAVDASAAGGRRAFWNRPIREGHAPARRVQIKQVIQAHLRDPEFSVSALSREMGLSSRYMQMLFQDGPESISQYIRRQRLEGCRKQLADPAFRERSVTEISFSWGFNSAAHFCRAFRAQYRTSPTLFRFSQAAPG